MPKYRFGDYKSQSQKNGGWLGCSSLRPLGRKFFTPNPSPMNRNTTLSTFFIAYHQTLDKHGMVMLRVSLAIVFIWFGGLKIVGLSPAQELVEQTVFWFPPQYFVPFLGFWEVAMGIGLLFKRLIPYTVIPLLFHLACTFLPLVILPDVCFDTVPYQPSLVGQYILKNFVLIAAVLYVSAKGSVKMQVVR